MPVLTLSVFLFLASVSFSCLDFQTPADCFPQRTSSTCRRHCLVTGLLQSYQIRCPPIAVSKPAGCKYDGLGYMP